MSGNSQVVSIILKLFQLFLKNSYKFLFLGGILVIVKILITELFRFFTYLFDISPNSSFFSQISLVELSVFGSICIVVFYFLCFLTGIYFQLLKNIITNQKQGTKSIIITSFQKITSLAFIIIVQFFALSLLFSFFILPGVIFFIFWLFTIPIVLFEDKKGFLVFKESTQKISGEFFTLLLIVILLSIIFFIFHNIFLNATTFILEKYISNSIFELIVEFLIMSVILSMYLLVPTLIVIGNHTLTQTKTPPVDSKEEIAKSYILEYRDNYSKQAIINVLAKELVTLDEAKEFVEKYY